jgi:manganese/iron transport system permease protein
MLAVAVIVAVIASFLGVYLSFFIDSAPAPTIVLLMTIAFIAAFVFVTSKAARLQRHKAVLAVEPNDPGSGQSRM